VTAKAKAMISVMSVAVTAICSTFDRRPLPGVAAIELDADDIA